MTIKQRVFTLIVITVTAIAGSGSTAMAVDPLTLPPHIRHAGFYPGQYRGTFYFVNRGTGRCLDAFASGNGLNANRVGLWDCNAGYTERWSLYDTGQPWPYTRAIINWKSARSLDYPGMSGGANGWQYQIWDYRPTAGQKFWMYWYSSAAEYDIGVEIGGPYNVMDAFQSGGGQNGNPVGNWSTTNHPLQRWRLSPICDQWTPHC